MFVSGNPTHVRTSVSVCLLMAATTPPPGPAALRPLANLPILEDNPYAGHPELSVLEADVLWEYAKMAAMVRQVS